MAYSEYSEIEKQWFIKTTPTLNVYRHKTTVNLLSSTCTMPIILFIILITIHNVLISLTQG